MLIDTVVLFTDKAKNKIMSIFQASHINEDLPSLCSENFELYASNSVTHQS